MSQAFVFLGWTFLLGLEGFLTCTAITRSTQSVTERSALALPIAALINALIIFSFTVFSIAIQPLNMLLTHAVLIIALAVFVKRRLRRELPAADTQQHPSYRRMRPILFVLLCVIAVFSFAHSVLLPTYHIDSLTNWTMRSKVSFYDHAIAYDSSEARGVAKPQYPILFHSLQITVNQGNAEWNDRSANAILFLLSVASFAAIFLLLKIHRGVDHALIVTTALLSVPLLTFHLAQGYADILLVQYLLLASVLLWISLVRRSCALLIISAVFIAAAAWTKSEGWIIGTLPWFAIVLFQSIRHRQCALYLPAIVTAVFLSSVHPLFLISRGLSLTPHGSDTALSCHSRAVWPALTGLISSGSMGVTWTVIICSTWWIYIHRSKQSVIDRSALPLAVWGLWSIVIILVTYTCTANAAFLLNGESYFRQLLVPASLLILWVGSTVKSTQK